MKKESGFALVTVLMLLALLLSLLGVYYVTTSSELASVRSTKNATTGFFSAEGGLNTRAEIIRQVFVGFNRPAGTSPGATNPCAGGNSGSGDYQCESYNLNDRNVISYVNEDSGNPVILTIPPGERYQNLNAQEYSYTAVSKARNKSGETEAHLELRFKSRLVPLFQFAAFYNKDLEILPGPPMTLSGPVHTNGDLYLMSDGNSLTINGQVTSAGDLYRGRKNNNSCTNDPVKIYDPTSARSLIPNCGSRYKVRTTDVRLWNNMIQFRVPPVSVPGPDVFDATPGKTYWDHADLRLVLQVDSSENSLGIQVRDANDDIINGATTQINNCSGNISTKDVGTLQLWNYRENKNIRILDVDLRAVLNCLYSTNWFGTGRRLDDTTDGGLVFHLTVKGPKSNHASNPYGVRIQNAQTIRSTNGSAPLPKGFTVVSDQAVYVRGHFNSTNKIPAAVMADSINVLSTNWSDGNAHSGLGSRVAANTIINAAFLAGTDTTGGVDGSGGQNGAYNGGLENYPRFHEDWSGGKVLTYRGSFVSLGTPRHVNGPWSAQSYNPPNRDWNYDTSFNNAANLPPITPRFVYLRQELFVRDFNE